MNGGRSTGRKFGKAGQDAGYRGRLVPQLPVQLSSAGTPSNGLSSGIRTPCRRSASGLNPMIKSRPWSASRRDIAPTYHTRDRTQFRAIGIANATSNDMRNSKPSSHDGQRPRDRRNRHAEKNPCQREPGETGDCSRHPLTACDGVRRIRIFPDRALGTVRHLHERCLAQLV